jgi:hypothetical protein
MYSLLRCDWNTNESIYVSWLHEQKELLTSIMAEILDFRNFVQVLTKLHGKREKFSDMRLLNWQIN